MDAIKQFGHSDGGKRDFLVARSADVERLLATQGQAPSDTVTFSQGRSKLFKALPILAAAGAGLAGFALGNNGGLSGALASTPVAGLGLLGATGLGLVVDISDSINGDSQRMSKTSLRRRAPCEGRFSGQRWQPEAESVSCFVVFLYQRRKRIEFLAIAGRPLTRAVTSGSGGPTPQHSSLRPSRPR